MDNNASEIQSLIDRPGESLSVELKRWIDPDSKAGKAKIVKAAIALRNYNGGYLVIGFDNETLQPDADNIPEDVMSRFHIDKVQGLVTRFASEPFEVSVKFPERDKQAFPVIVVPTGVKNPVAAKSDLFNENNRKLISTDDVYIRSLRSNNTPSTTKAKWNDWPSIMDTCFDNREADIGRFVRRQLGNVTPEMVRQLYLAVATEIKPEPTQEALLQTYLQESRNRYEQIVGERNLELPQHGVWEAAFLIDGEVPEHSANQVFLNLINVSNPRYSGWPLWIDSSRLQPQDYPYVHDGIWEEFIDHHTDSWFRGIDFIRMDPSGRFYQYRALEDDFRNSERGPDPLTVLDFGIPISRSAEAIAVGLAFAKAMGCEPESTTLSFAFRWSHLKNRRLSRWAQPRWMGGPINKKAYQDEHTSYVRVPLDSPLSTLGEYVTKVVKPMFELFNGFVLEKSSVEEITRRCIERKTFS